MSNFQFLAAEFKPLFAPARAAEPLVQSDGHGLHILLGAWFM